MAINQTIDEIFSRFGVDATDLTRRAENALIRAQNAKLVPCIYTCSIDACTHTHTLTHTHIHAHFFNRLTIYRALAVELAANASTLESLLQELADQEQSLRENLTQSENTNSETELVITEVCTC